MKILKRIFIDGLSGMAIGLFATLITGTILEQIGTFAGGNIGHMIVMAASIAKVLTGAGIGIGTACKLGEETLVCLSSKCRDDRSICNRIVKWKCCDGWKDFVKRPGRTIGCICSSICRN